MVRYSILRIQLNLKPVANVVFINIFNDFNVAIIEQIYSSGKAVYLSSLFRYDESQFENHNF